MPKAAIIHQSQAFSPVAKSVEFLTIKVHLARDKPKPERAPYLIQNKSNFTLSISYNIQSNISSKVSP